MAPTPLNQASNITTQANEIIGQMNGIISFVIASNVAGEPLTSTQIQNLKNRFFTLRDQAVTLLNSLSAV